VDGELFFSSLLAALVKNGSSGIAWLVTTAFMKENAARRVELLASSVKGSPSRIARENVCFILWVSTLIQPLLH
jgi:hypothetical protein